MTRPASRLVLASLLCSAALTVTTGCSDLGNHALSVEGSDAVTAGLSTTDGWDVTFTSLVVVVHHPGLIEQIDYQPTWVREYGVSVWDVVQPVAEDERIGTPVRATDYDGAQFRVAPASESEYEAFAGNVADSVVDEAVEGDWAVHVVGTATDGNATVSFDWTFTTSQLYRCSLKDDAIQVTVDGDEVTVLTIFGEALFVGDGGSNFQPFANADADNDGVITDAELDAAGLLDGLAATPLGGVQGVGVCDVVED